MDATSTGLDLAAYRRRIGDDGPLAPTREVLERLHRAHQASIPFENLDIQLGRPILLDLPSLEAKLVHGRRGGYCFEQNTLFATALDAIGFRVTRLAARVRAGMTPGSVRPRGHMTLEVAFADGPVLADVGFGGEGLDGPIDLAEGARRPLADGRVFSLRREDGAWVLVCDDDGVVQDQYVFTREPQFPMDYEMGNWFTSTWPRSGFVTTLTAQRVLPDGFAVLRDRLLVERHGRTRTETVVADAEQLLDVLRERFGLDFPSGTRFRNPSFT